MTLTERLTDAHRRAAALYLDRQQIEAHRQRINQDAQQCELAMVRTDGEVELLTKMIAEEQKAADGQ